VIVAVAGGKGGVGKSTIAYNLGAALDAVVVDADLGMADLPTGMGPDLHDVLAGRADPREAIRTGPVELLPCGRSLAGARAADLTALQGAMAAVERERDRVVVDCPAGLRADAGVPLAIADAAVLVVSPRAFALADAVRTRELARELDAGLAGVALNRACEETLVEPIERTLGAPATTVPADPRLGESIQRAAPVSAVASDSRAAAAIRELATAVRRCERA
jgi:septum site-determining protein MinD